jgi:tetratricopeptide (TPR) repeat protein
MQTEYEFDVFISYSSHDKAWVRGELLKRIEQAGLRAFIDFRDFMRGAPSIKECERGVVKCRKTLVVITPAYIKSGWAEIENIMAQTLDPANRDLRLIPLLKAPCEKPLRIGALTDIDFTRGADLDLAWRQLLTALGAPPPPAAPSQPRREDWCLAHPYPMPPNFTGRVAERAMLDDWLNADASHPLLVLRALGGFGKSALAWQWLLHDVDPVLWPRVVWWSFYEGDASFDSFLERSIEYLRAGDPAGLGPSQRVEALLKVLHQAGTLLILDGFERLLRAFGGLNAAYRGDEVGGSASDCDCVSPHAEVFLRGVAALPGMRGRVSLTTRLRPTAVGSRGDILLQGCREEDVPRFRPADAVQFFGAHGVRGTHTEIEATCEVYGYHPLSLRLLVGLIVSDLQQPGDIAATKRLDVSGDLVARQHHVLERSYDSLAPARQALLSRIACFRGPVKYEALKALAVTEDRAGEPKHIKGSTLSFDADLQGLVARGLLHQDTKAGRFDLHPIVRRYAYDRLAAPDRAAAHTRLRDYFASVPKADKVTRLEDLAPVIELYHHTVSAGQLDEACRLLRARLVPLPLFMQFGAYQLCIDLLHGLFPDGDDCPPRLVRKRDRSWAANALGASYSFSGQTRLAVGLFGISARLDESDGDKKNLAVDLVNLADDQLKMGAVRDAEANVRRGVVLCQEIGQKAGEATAYGELARLLAYRGAYAESEAAEAVSTRYWNELEDTRGLCLNQRYHSVRELLRLRSVPDSASGARCALDSARRALELADEATRAWFPAERDYVWVNWLLGAAYRVAGQHDQAGLHLHEALERCRRINLVELEAGILIDLARLRAAVGTQDDAQRLAEAALVITERSDYVLQGADAHLELAKLALARGDKPAARYHAAEARRLATCDGPPDYTYRVAYDEAGALLAGSESQHESNGACDPSDG